MSPDINGDAPLHPPDRRQPRRVAISFASRWNKPVSISSSIPSEDGSRGLAAGEAALQARPRHGGGKTQSEIAVTAAQTRLAEAQYDYKIAELTLAYSAGGRGQMEIDSTIRSAERDRLKAEVFGASNPAFEPSDRCRPARRAAGYFFCLARASAMAIAIVPAGCGWRSGTL